MSTTTSQSWSQATGRPNTTGHRTGYDVVVDEGLIAGQDVAGLGLPASQRRSSCSDLMAEAMPHKALTERRVLATP